MHRHTQTRNCVCLHACMSDSLGRACALVVPCGMPNFLDLFLMISVGDWVVDETILSIGK